MVQLKGIPRELSVDNVIGFVGLSCCFAWSTTIFSSPVFTATVASGDSSIIGFKAVAFFAATLTAAIISALAYPILRHSLLLLAGGSLLIVPMVLLTAMEPMDNQMIGLVIWSLAGIGTICLFLLFSGFLSSLMHRTIFLTVAAALLLAIFLEFEISYMQTPVNSFSIIIIALCSVFCGVFHTVRIRVVCGGDPVTNSESRVRSKIFGRSLVMLSLNYAVLGFVLVFVLLRMPDNQHFFLVFGAGCAFACVLWIVDSLVAQRISERSLFKPVLPLTVCGLAPLMLFGDIVQLACVFVLAAVQIIYLLLGLSAVAENVRISHLSALHAFARIQALNGLGLLIGATAAWLALEVFGQGSLGASAVSVLSVCLVVTIVSFCHVIHYPEPDMERSAVWSMQQKKNYWRRRCLVVADVSNLSERQTEVLLLLAKGRNSRYIEQELNISSSTAKTHIYNIYQKVGVHTRQELISRIEKIPLFEEGGQHSQTDYALSRNV